MSPVPAAEVLDRRETAGHDDPGVPPGNAVQVHPNGGGRVRPEDVFAVAERDLAIAPDDAAVEFRSVRRDLGGDAGRFGTEGVSESVDGADVLWFAGLVAEAVSEHFHEARQAALRNKSVGPEPIPQLVLRQRLRSRRNQDLEQPVSLWLDVYGLPGARKLARIEIQRAITELNSHRGRLFEF
jgi:hypothetical protein